MSFAALENNNQTSNEVLFEITLDARAKFFLECLAEHSSVLHWIRPPFRAG